MNRLFHHFGFWGIFLLSSDAAFAFDPFRQSVRSLGVAGAYSAIADDESAFFLNPAGLSRNAEMRKFSISGEFQKKPRSNWGLQTSVIDGLTEDPIHWGFLFDMLRGENDRYFDYELATSFNYKGFLMVGIQNRIVNYNHASASSEFTGFAMGAGLLAILGEHITLSATGQNFVRTEKNDAYLPMSFGFGTSFNLEWLRASAEFERNQSEELNYGRFGVELMASDYFVMRGGYVTDLNGDYRAFAAGLSLIPSERFSLDGAYFKQLESDFYLANAGITVRFD